MPFDKERISKEKRHYSAYCACCHKLRTFKGAWVQEFATDEDLAGGLLGLGAVLCPGCRPATTS